MGRVIEIADRLAFISLHRGFMKVQIDKVLKANIALSDIDVLILNGTGIIPITTHNALFMLHLFVLKFK